MARASVTPDAVAGAPVIEKDEEGLTDSVFERSVIVGAIVGTLAMTVLTFVIAVAGGIDVETAAFLSPWPGLVAGVFFGGNAFLGAAMTRSEHDRRH